MEAIITMAPKVLGIVGATTTMPTGREEVFGIVHGTRRRIMKKSLKRIIMTTRKEVAIVLVHKTRRRKKRTRSPLAERMGGIKEVIPVTRTQVGTQKARKRKQSMVTAIGRKMKRQVESSGSGWALIVSLNRR